MAAVLFAVGRREKPAMLFFCFLRLFASFCAFLFLSVKVWSASAASCVLHKPVGVIQDELFELTHTMNRLLTSFGSAKEIVDGGPVARGLTRPFFSVSFQAVGNHQKQLVSVLCTLGSKSTMVLHRLACHGADFGGSALLASEPVGLPPLVAPIVLIRVLEGANVSFLQYLFECLMVSEINFDRLVLRLDEASQPAGVHVQDVLSSMFQSLGSSLWCATKIREHFITEILFLKKSGDVNDEANFPFYFLLHKLHKPAPSPSALSLRPLPPLIQDCA